MLRLERPLDETADSRNSLPDHWRSGLNSQLAAERNSLAWFETDLNPLMQFTSELVAITDRRILSYGVLPSETSAAAGHHVNGEFAAVRDTFLIDNRRHRGLAELGSLKRSQISFLRTLRPWRARTNKRRRPPHAMALYRRRSSGRSPLRSSLANISFPSKRIVGQRFRTPCHRLS